MYHTLKERMSNRFMSEYAPYQLHTEKSETNAVHCQQKEQEQKGGKRLIHDMRIVHG